MRRKHNVDDDDENPRDVARDGEVVRTRLIMKDGQRALHDGMGHPAGYRSGFVFSGNTERHDAYDEARRAATAAYDEMCKRATEAWRKPVSVTPVIEDAAKPHADAERRQLEPDAAQQRRDRAWKDYCARLSTAWQTKPQAAIAVENLRRRWTAER